MLRIALALLLVSTNLTQALGQTRTLTVSFDTLYLHTNQSFHLLVSKKVFNNEHDATYDVIDTLFSRSLRQGLHKNVSFSMIITISTDSSELLISLDNDGGYMRILDWALDSNDNIRFNYWQTYSNCNQDSVFKTTAHYERSISQLDSMKTGTLLRVKKKTEIQKKKCLYPAPSHNIAFTMNGQHYITSIKKVLAKRIIKHSHGFDKDIYRKKYPKDKKLIFKHTVIETKKYCNTIVVHRKRG